MPTIDETIPSQFTQLLNAVCLTSKFAETFFPVRIDSFEPECQCAETSDGINGAAVAREAAGPKGSLPSINTRMMSATSPTRHYGFAFMIFTGGPGP